MTNFRKIQIRWIQVSEKNFLIHSFRKVSCNNEMSPPPFNQLYQTFSIPLIPPAIQTEKTGRSIKNALNIFKENVKLYYLLILYLFSILGGILLIWIKVATTDME